MSDKNVFRCPHCGALIQVIALEGVPGEQVKQAAPETDQFREGDTVNFEGVIRNLWEKSGVSQSGFSWKLKTLNVEGDHGQVLDVKLWNKLADEDLKAGQKIRLTGFKVEKYEGKLFLKSDKNSKVEVL